MKVVFAFDIDGTLTHRHDWVCPQVTRRLTELCDAGYPLYLITGRTFSFAQKVLHYFDFPHVLSVQNGADLLEMPSKRRIARYYLDGASLSAVEAAHAGLKDDFIIYAGMDWGDFCYYRPERFSEEMHPYLDKLKSLGVAPWKAGDFHLEKVEFPLVKSFGDHAAMARVHAALCTDPQFEVSMIEDPIDPRFYLNLITHPMANKGSVVDFIRKRHPGSVVIAAGNDLNDYKMLERADVAIAIDTAPKALIALGDIIAKAPKQRGILEAIEEALAHAR